MLSTTQQQTRWLQFNANLTSGHHCGCCPLRWLLCCAPAGLLLDGGMPVTVRAIQKLNPTDCGVTFISPWLLFATTSGRQAGVANALTSIQRKLDKWSPVVAVLHFVGCYAVHRPVSGWRHAGDCKRQQKVHTLDGGSTFTSPAMTSSIRIVITGARAVLAVKSIIVVSDSLKEVLTKKTRWH